MDVFRFSCSVLLLIEHFYIVQEIANIKLTISPPAYFQWALGSNKYIQGVYDDDGMGIMLLTLSRSLSTSRKKYSN